MGYFEAPGAEHQTHHPSTLGDATTLFYFSLDALHELSGTAVVPHDPLRLPGHLELMHRGLVSALVRATDALEVEERIVDLVYALLWLRRPRRATGRRLNTALEHRRLVDAATEAIVADPTDWDLRSLAHHIGYSPYHLSRTFRSIAGLTLSEFRNRVRTAMVADRIQQGEADMTRLAHDLGFADLSHMIRVVRSQFGVTPGWLRDQVRSDADVRGRRRLG